MFKKLFFSAVISAILSVNAFGVDLLTSVTNGKISDNSPGVKVLSLEEAKQVKGGSLYYDTAISNNMMIAFMIPETIQETQPISLDGKGFNSAAAYTSGQARDKWLGYSVTKHISSSNGKKYAYFTYDVYIYNKNIKMLTKITSSSLLNNNYAVKTLANKFKTTFEARMGGYNVR